MAMLIRKGNGAHGVIGVFIASPPLQMIYKDALKVKLKLTQPLRAVGPQNVLGLV